MKTLSKDKKKKIRRYKKKDTAQKITKDKPEKQRMQREKRRERRKDDGSGFPKSLVPIIPQVRSFVSSELLLKTTEPVFRCLRMYSFPGPRKGSSGNPLGKALQQQLWYRIGARVCVVQTRAATRGADWKLK